MGKPSWHLPIGATLKGKYTVEHVAEGDQGSKTKRQLLLDFEIGVRVVLYPITLRGWRPGGRRGVA